MSNLDIPFPEDIYNEIDKYLSFNLIYPSSHPFSQAIKIDMMVRVLAFPSEEYYQMLKSSEMKDLEPIAAKLFEISYIRECRLDKVTKTEWENNYGPAGPREFIELVPDTTLTIDSFVKITNLKVPTYNLGIFNRKYGHNAKYKKR